MVIVEHSNARESLRLVNLFLLVEKNKPEPPYQRQGRHCPPLRSRPLKRSRTSAKNVAPL
jgi:hypothetical protein